MNPRRTWAITSSEIFVVSLCLFFSGWFLAMSAFFPQGGKFGAFIGLYFFFGAILMGWNIWREHKPAEVSDE